MGNDGVVISESQPVDVAGKFTWLKPLAGGIMEFYEKVNGAWTLAYTYTPTVPAEVDSDVNFTADIYVDGDKGITGSRTIGGHTITFKNGILTGFESE